MVVQQPFRAGQRLGVVVARTLALLGMLFAVACQPAAPAGPMVDLTGVVTAGPVCPVVQDPPDPSCADRPVVGAGIAVTDEDGSEVARVISAADGTFSVRLSQGNYVVTPQPVQGLMGTPAPISVTLTADVAPEPLVIVYDTGIR